MQQFLGNPNSGLLNLQAHQLALAIPKKTLDENCFKTAMETMDREPPSSKIVTQSTLKSNSQENGIWKWELDIGLFAWVQQTLPTHWKSGYRENEVMQHQGHSIEPPVEFWKIDTQFGRARKNINHLPTIMLNIWRWTPYSCKYHP